MELIMTTDLEKSLPKAIDFNHEQLKTELSEKLGYYNSLVVTEDSIKGAKSNKSNLNALRTALEDKRKSVKKECMKPYDAFEMKIKELVGMIDEPIRAIDGQIKFFDDAKKAEKQAGIELFYSSNIEELSELLPLSKIWNDRWLNATFKMPEIEDEITKEIFKVKNDIGIIKAMRLECEQHMFDTYLRTFDMSAALAEKTRFEEQQKRLKEYEAVKKKEPVQEMQEVKAAPEPAPVQTKAPQEEPKTICVKFEDTTAEFRHEMSALCQKHGIKYGWAKKEDIN